MKKTTIKTKQSFNEAFLAEFNQLIPQVNLEHMNRTVRAILLLIEHTRKTFSHSNPEQSAKMAAEYVRRLLALELVNNAEIQKRLWHEEDKLLNEAELHLIEDSLGMHAMEIAMTLKASTFKRIREKAELLMIRCTGSYVRSRN